MITKSVAYSNSEWTRWDVFDNGKWIGTDDVPANSSYAGNSPTLEIRRALPKTGIAIGIGGGAVDLNVTWRDGAGAAAPFSAVGAPRVTIAEGLPAGVTAAVLGTPNRLGCVVRVSATVLVAIGLEVDVTASMWA